MRKKATQNSLHEYYTPKSIIFQEFLFIFTIFVNYADFYVNIIMLTAATNIKLAFIKFNYFAIYWARKMRLLLNIEFASNLAKMYRWVKYIYLPRYFVQLNDRYALGHLSAVLFLRPVTVLWKRYCRTVPRLSL